MEGFSPRVAISVCVSPSQKKIMIIILTNPRWSVNIGEGAIPSRAINQALVMLATRKEMIIITQEK